MHGAAGLQDIINHDAFDQRLEQVLSPALAPVLTYVARTPALSGAITKVLSNDSPLVRHSALLTCMITMMSWRTFCASVRAA